MAEEIIKLDSYIDLAKRANTHTAKFSILEKLLNEVFKVQIQDLLPGIEKKIGSKVLGVRGSIDLLYSNVIFEIKVDLEKELDVAKEELKKYFQAMFESRPFEKFIGIVTDVINYKAFLPIIEENKVKGVKEVSSINISEVSANDAILWLDSYLFSKARSRPSAKDLKFRFGPMSPTYNIAIDILKQIYMQVKDEEDVKLKYDLWSKSMEIVYGSKPNIEVFIDQTYLVTLVKLIVYLRLSGVSIITPDDVLKSLTGEYFIKYGIANLFEEDFFTWIIHPKIVNTALNLVKDIAKELLRYDLTQIDEDFFKEIYQEIVEKGQRHRVGEYYTPEWLTKLILEEVLKLLRENHKELPRILDPACGSGTFLCNAIHMLREELARNGLKSSEMLNFILANVIGVDINPLAVIIARANYIIALGELLLTHEGSILLPIYVADSIKLPESTNTIIGNMKVYDYVVNNSHLQVPADVAKDRSRLSKVIAAFKEAIEFYRSKKDRSEAQKVFEKALEGLLTNIEFSIIRTTQNEIFLWRNVQFFKIMNKIYIS